MGQGLGFSPPCCCEGSGCPNTLFVDGIVPTALQFELSGTARGTPTGTPSSGGYANGYVWRNASVCTINALSTGPAGGSGPYLDSDCVRRYAYALAVTDGLSLYRADIYDEVDFFGNVIHHDEWTFIGNNNGIRQATVWIGLVGDRVKMRPDVALVGLGSTVFTFDEQDLGAGPIDPSTAVWTVPLTPFGSGDPACTGVTSMTITPQMP